MQHLVPGRMGTSQAQCFTRLPPKADISPELGRLVLAQCFPPQALRSSKGLQQEAVLVQSRDTVGMLKQGHQSHRDLNLSKLAL